MGVRAIAKQLGISAGQASRLHKQGMPVDSLEAARRWRDIHLDPRYMKFTTGPSASVADDYDLPEFDDDDLRLLGEISTLDPAQVDLDFLRPEYIAIAMRESGIALSPAQCIDVTVILMLCVMGEFPESTVFHLPDTLQTAPGTASHEALLQHLAQVMAEGPGLVRE